MIIDLILDRKDGKKYNQKKFTFDCQYYDKIFGMDNELHSVGNAMTTENEAFVKKCLCNYIVEKGYNPELCNYVNSVRWIRKRRKISQEEKVLNELKYNGEISNVTAFLNYGIYRLGAIIYSLREQGYLISTTKEKSYIRLTNKKEFYVQVTTYKLIKNLLK